MHIYIMVNFAIIGSGRISDWVLAGAVQERRFRLVAVCSRNKESAEQFIERNASLLGDVSDISIYTSVEALAADTRVDAVYIGTPNQTHCEYAVTCLNAGKNVLCEKPLAVNYTQGQMMADAAMANGKLLMEAMISTVNPNFRAAAEKVAEISPVRQYTSSYCQFSSRYEALKNGQIANTFRPHTGGGLRDIGIYTLYPLISLFGKPDAVIPNLRKYKTDEGEVDVHGSLLLRYAGMDATLIYSKICDAHTPTTISGENGEIILDAVHIARAVKLIPKFAPTSGQDNKAHSELIAQGLDKNPYYYEFKEFVDLVEEGLTESSINSLKISLDTLAVIDEALYLSKLD